MAALDRLEASGLLERRGVKEYYTATSEILRRFIDARFQIEAMELTSNEVLERLKGLGLDPELHSAFTGLFRESDLVKFAREEPPDSICRALIPLARSLVESTRSAAMEAAPAVSRTAA